MKSPIFQEWVPQRLHFPILLSMAFLIACCGSIPSTIYPYMVTDQVANNADLSMAMFAYYTGMVCAIPFIMRLATYMAKKRIILGCLIGLFTMNVLLAINTHPLITVMSTFVIGNIKIMISLAIIMELMPFLMPTGERYQMYTIYYPISLISPFIVSLIAVYLAERYEWQVSFHFQNAVLLLALMVVLATFKTQTFKPIPLYQFDWFGAVLLASAMLVFSFVMAYGLMDNWFYSPSIIFAIVLGIALSAAYLNRSARIKRPLIDFSLFSDKAVWKTLFTMFVFGIFFASSGITTNLLNILAPGNPVKVGEINTFIIIGYVLGAIIVYFYFKRTKKCKLIFLFTVLLYFLSTLMLLELVNSQTKMEYLIFPIILRGMAVMISFVASAVYLAGNVSPKYYRKAVVLFIFFRTFFITAFWSTLLSNWYTHLLVIYQQRISENAKGLPTPSMQQRISVQASVQALHDLYIYLLIAALLVFLLILLIPYHSSLQRRIFNWGDKKNASELIQAAS